MNTRLCAAVAIMAALAGCSQVPIARESATFGVGVIGEMESALSDFRAMETASYQARQISLRDQHTLAREAMAALKATTLSRESAGDAQAQLTTQRLLANADARAASEATLAEQASTQNKTLDALFTPLPSTQKATREAQKSLALLAADLSVQDQFSSIRTYARTVKTAVDENKKKIAAAKKAAAAKAASQ